MCFNVCKGPDTETYLECTKGKSSKYYKVRIDHCTVTCEVIRTVFLHRLATSWFNSECWFPLSQYGKIGARDAADRSDFASEEEAQTFYAKKIKEKTAKAKGYRKVNLNAKVFKRCKAAWAKLLKNDSKPLNASSERPSKVRKTDADQRSDESKQRESDQQAIGFLDIDKGAEAVAYGICRSANISCCGEDIHLLDCLFPGSKTVGDDVHYGPIRLVRADQIRDLWQTLEPLTAGQISDSLIPQKDPGWPLVLGALCYDKSMASLPQEDLDYLLFHFKQFKRFIEACAQREDIGLLIRFA